MHGCVWCVHACVHVWCVCICVMHARACMWHAHVCARVAYALCCGCVHAYGAFMHAVKCTVWCACMHVVCMRVYVCGVCAERCRQEELTREPRAGVDGSWFLALPVALGNSPSCSSLAAVPSRSWARGRPLFLMIHNKIL